MTEVERIADQLRRAVEGEAWHGPALLELLEGMTAEEAALRTSSAHTVWEIVLHVAAWMSASRRRVQGEAVSLAPEEDWPAADVPDEAAWSRLRVGLEGEYRSLLSAVRALPEQALEAVVPGQDYSTYFLLHGVIQHTLYHAGQIAYARRIHDADEDPSRSLLRHIVATLAYRAAKTTCSRILWRAGWVRTRRPRAENSIDLHANLEILFGEIRALP